MNLELRGEHWAGIQLGLQADACNLGAAVEVDAIGEQQPKRDQQLKRTQSGGMQADAIGGQVDASGEQQLCTESCLAPDYSR